MHELGYSSFSIGSSHCKRCMLHDIFRIGMWLVRPAHPGVEGRFSWRGTVLLFPHIFDEYVSFPGMPGCLASIVVALCIAHQCLCISPMVVCLHVSPQSLRSSTCLRPTESCFVLDLHDFSYEVNRPTVYDSVVYGIVFADPLSGRSAVIFLNLNKRPLPLFYLASNLCTCCFSLALALPRIDRWTCCRAIDIR